MTVTQCLLVSGPPFAVSQRTQAQHRNQRLTSSSTPSFQSVWGDGSTFVRMSVESISPVRSLRHYVGLLREGYLLDKLRSRLESVHTRGFRVLSLEPRHKDGGVFVRFQYDLQDDSNHALDDILTQTRHVISEYSGFPSWMGGRQGGNAWLVKGIPWKEVRRRLVGRLGQRSNVSQDMDRFASSMLKVTFEGPDVHEQSLFQTFRVSS